MQNACKTVGLLYSSANYLPPVNRKSLAVGPIAYPPEFYCTRYFAYDNSTVGRNMLTNNFVKASHSGRDALSKQSNGLFVAKAGSNL